VYNYEEKKMVRAYEV